jgi:hypothetical protein
VAKYGSQVREVIAATEIKTSHGHGHAVVPAAVYCKFVNFVRANLARWNVGRESCGACVTLRH